MDNMIKYFYNLEPTKINQINSNYYFICNDDQYILYLFNKNLKLSSIMYQYNAQLTKLNVLINEIVLNKEKHEISFINNIPYCLEKIYINQNKKINLQDILYISRFAPSQDKELQSAEWTELWSKKIDYLEYQISETGKKYPIIVDSFSYFIGMAENANSYIKNTLLEEHPNSYDKKIISHRKIKINDTITELYNPINIIIDHQSRDIAEYIKYSFFNNNQNIFKELDYYFKNTSYSKYGIRLLFGRCLYPSFYFEIYDSILLEEVKEEEIIKITDRINQYEEYLLRIYNYLNALSNIPDVIWITKK